MQWPTLSVITPSYNQAEFIERTIASVLSQDYPRLEYLVMDGGSRDGTVAILERHAAAGKLRFVSEKDGGQSAAVNEGFRRTTGEIIGWVNSDDLYAPNALRTVGAYFAEHPEVEWLFGRCPIIDRDDRPFKAGITRYKEFWLRHYDYRWLVVENFISQPAVFFRRRLLDRVGVLETDYHLAMDYHLWLRMGRVARPAFLDEELACFRSSGDNKMSLQWRKSFQEDLEAARAIAGGSHRLWVALHRLNGVKLSTAYWLLDRFGARARQ
ncbi:MAG TPA: glycosyltransferase family 2 protein [Polyangia bacterium]|nr:glycosyltransferase family 2 protein [Polyangia bacterium]